MSLITLSFPFISLPPVSLPSKIKRFVKPITSHPAFAITFQITVEIVKIIAVLLFLKILCQQLLKQVSYSQRWKNSIIAITLTGPLKEEIMYRGGILSVLSIIQKIVLPKVLKRKLTEKERSVQRFINVQISAFTFAAAHLANPYDKITLISQFVETYFFGVLAGYVYEKYQTLSIGILAHGIHNSLVVAMDCYPMYAPLFFTAISIQQLGFGILAFCKNKAQRIHFALFS